MKEKCGNCIYGKNCGSETMVKCDRFGFSIRVAKELMRCPDYDVDWFRVFVENVKKGNYHEQAG